jgi:hypothetical protein
MAMTTCFSDAPAPFYSHGASWKQRFSCHGFLQLCTPYDVDRNMDDVSRELVFVVHVGQSRPLIG